MKILRYCVIVLFAFVLASTAGCNTLKGAGKDIQQAGRALEDAAE